VGLAGFAFGVVALLTWNAPRLTTAEPLYIVLFIAAGAPGLAMASGLTSVLQQSTVDGERGRVFAALGVAAAAGQAAGMLCGGLFGHLLGVVPLLNAQGCAYLLAGAPALTWLSHRAGGGRPPVAGALRNGYRPFRLGTMIGTFGSSVRAHVRLSALVPRSPHRAALGAAALGHTTPGDTPPTPPHEPPPHEPPPHEPRPPAGDVAGRRRCGPVPAALLRRHDRGPGDSVRLTAHGSTAAAGDQLVSRRGRRSG
jgi:hypothetical protein